MLRKDIEKVRSTVKFIANPMHSIVNVVVTKTLKKIGVIDSEWLVNHNPDVYPQPDQFWVVDVLSETAPSEERGCLILRPVRKIDSFDLLLPGMYTEHIVDGILLIQPKSRGPNWIMTRKLKNAAMDRLNGKVFAIIVVADD